MRVRAVARICGLIREELITARTKHSIVRMHSPTTAQPVLVWNYDWGEGRNELHVCNRHYGGRPAKVE